VIEMPKLEPDEPEVVEDQVQPMAELAPPELNDTPQLVTDTSFVQAVQPPPPDSMNINRNLITIPPNTGSWGKGIQVFDPSQLDRQPVPTVQARPTYPFEMRRAGISGQVTVDFIVDVSGNVQNAFAASSSQRDFEAAAVQAVQKWRFRPGQRGGRAVNTHMQVPIVFTLNTDE
jgi:protein TonB